MLHEITNCAPLAYLEVAYGLNSWPIRKDTYPELKAVREAVPQIMAGEDSVTGIVGKITLPMKEKPLSDAKKFDVHHECKDKPVRAALFTAKEQLDSAIAPYA